MKAVLGGGGRRQSQQLPGSIAKGQVKVQNPRLASIETFRVFAIFAIICIHAEPFLNVEGYQFLGCLILNACRFAIPFFFVTSGYFFGRSLQEGAALFPLLRRYLKRLLILFLSWSLIYGLFPHAAIKNIFRQGLLSGAQVLYDHALSTFRLVIDHPVKFSLNGTAIHLWFFSALIMGLLILSFFLWRKKQKYLLPFSIILFFIGLLTINNTPFHLRLPGTFAWGGGPFYAPFFVTLGWWWAGQNKTPSVKLALFLIVTGFVMRMTEMLFFWKYFGEVPLLPNAFTLGTAPYGVGVFLLALAKPDMGGSTILPRVGKLTLGIYASHLLILRNLPYGVLQRHLGPVVAAIAVPFLVFFLAAGLTLLLRRFGGPTRFLVV